MIYKISWNIASPKQKEITTMNTDLPVCHSVYLVVSKYTLILTLNQIIKMVIKTGKTFIGAMFSHISFFKT